MIITVIFFSIQSGKNHISFSEVSCKNRAFFVYSLKLAVQKDRGSIKIVIAVHKQALQMKKKDLANYFLADNNQRFPYTVAL